MARVQLELDYEAIGDPERMAKIPAFLFLAVGEDAMKSAARVVAKRMRQSKRFKDRSKTLRRSIRSAGSRFTKFVPSARVIAGPGFHLVDQGHKIYGPPRGVQVWEHPQGGLRTKRGTRYTFSGKRTRPRNILRSAMKSTRTKQNQQIRKIMRMGINRVFMEFSKEKYSKKSLKALNQESRYIAWKARRSPRFSFLRRG